MLTLPDTSWLEESIRLNEMDVRYVLLIDGEDFSNEIVRDEGEWGIDDSGVCYLDFILSTPVPTRLENAPVQFYVEIDGILVPQVTGVDSESEIWRDRTDPFHARSALGLANEVTLDEDLDLEGWKPEDVVRKALLKLPYPRGGIKVEKVGEPNLYFTRAETNEFTEDKHPSEVLSAVLEKAPYVYSDRYTGGHLASASIALGAGIQTSRTYSADEILGSGDTENKGWRPPVRAEPQYSRVVVYRRNPDDSFAFHAEANISYKGDKYPPRNRTYYVSLEDPTGEGPEKAQTMAHSLAKRFRQGVYKDETVLPSLDPLLERGDAFKVMDNHKDRDGSWERMWLCRVETIKKEIVNPVPTVGYEAALVAQSKVETPTLLLTGISSGVFRQDYGAEGDDLFFSELPWVAIDGDDLVFYDDGPVEVDGDDLVVSE